MGRGGKTGTKKGRKQHVEKKSIDSEDSDEDYVAEVDEVDDQSDELDSLVGDVSDDSFLVEDEEEEEEWGSGVKSRIRKGSARSANNGVKRSKKRRKLTVNDEEDSDSDDDDDDEEFAPEEEDDGWRTVVKPRIQTGSARSASNGVKRSKKRRKVTVDDEEDSDDDEDDEEFTPDEIDSLGEEDEFPVSSTKAKKRGKTSVTRKSCTKSRKGKRGRKRSAKAVRNPTKRGTKKSKSSKQKEKSDDDEDFMEKGLVIRGRIKKKPGRRKRIVADGSDSDFCSDSSNYEFTVSEEEREQVREANELCGRLATNLRSSRRIQEDEAPCEPRKPSVKKGKQKEEETKNDMGKPVCGICLTEEGRNSIRGTLSCCSHYFCYACIMEWSKVESRCPLCKQRFVTISKSSKGTKWIDARNPVVHVPERDQVYQPSEEELRDFLNPYENVICTECHLGGDDALMLLCDLCDSPAHTYCVGLGREVPEGNWYCDGCRPAAVASAHSQTQDLTFDQTDTADDFDGPPTYENMAEIDLNVTIPETPVSQTNGFIASPRYSGGSFPAPSPVSGRGVSTVSGRRMIHRQIQSYFSGRSLLQRGDHPSARPTVRRVDSAFQQGSVADVGASYHAQHVDRFPENSSPFVQNGDFFPGRVGHMMGGQLGQSSRPSTSREGPDHHLWWSELDRINPAASQTQLLNCESLHPCTSRSSTRPEIGACPSNWDGSHPDTVRNQVYENVSSQLKCLSRDMDLSDDAYADIFKKSVQTIMAAYGLEPRWPHIHEVGIPHCLHFDRVTNVEMSPMNNCCLACFEGFVKDVVKRMMEIIVGIPQWLNFR